MPCRSRSPSRVDLGSVAYVGHSAGGHLALWAALRDGLPAGAPGRAERAPLVRGVVALAPAADLAAVDRLGLSGGAVRELLGGSPATVPDRFAATDPAVLGRPRRRHRPRARRARRHRADRGLPELSDRTGVLARRGPRHGPLRAGRSPRPRRGRSSSPRCGTSWADAASAQVQTREVCAPPGGTMSTDLFETPAADAEPAAFADRLLAATLGGMDLVAIHLGRSLGWHQALVDDGPLTSVDLAARTGTQERYAREWLQPCSPATPRQPGSRASRSSRSTTGCSGSAGSTSDDSSGWPGHADRLRPHRRGRQQAGEVRARGPRSRRARARLARRASIRAASFSSAIAVDLVGGDPGVLERGHQLRVGDERHAGRRAARSRSPRPRRSPPGSSRDRRAGSRSASR